jgi:predicted small lipoprotein YifL
VNTRTRPAPSRLAALLALPLAAFVAGCGTGGDLELPAGPAAIVTDADPGTAGIDPVLPSADPLPAPEASGDPVPSFPASGSGSAEPAAVEDSAPTIDFDPLDADLAELDSQLSEADLDLATPEGDF